MGALAKGRMEGLKELAAEKPTPDMVVVGPLVDPRVHEVRTFLHRNRLSFDTVNTPRRDRGRRRAGGRHGGLVEPTMREIALAGGLAVAPARDEYDVVIVGGGPTGLTAAVNGAAEGLRTLVVEKFAPGGQAGTSTRIENYTGFPFGVSGDELASKALRQAKRLGAEIVVTRQVEAVDPGTRTLTLDGGARIGAQVVLLTSGVEWRHARDRGRRPFVGKGVYYGAARSDSGLAHGQDVVIIGAGNSAGQAALFFSRYARCVTLVVRGESLAASMSQYLIEQIGSNRRITVQTRSEVVALHGQDDLEQIEVVDRRTGTVDVRTVEVLFVMIGADAVTGWLPPRGRARRARVRADRPRGAAPSGAWTQAREPFALETTVPGVFAAGDVRSGSVKRVAAGVGEGGMAIAFVHQFLALPR